MDLAGTWVAFGSSSTFAYLAALPETWSFRVTVTFGDEAAATSNPLAITWKDPEPEPEGPEPEPEEPEPEPEGPEPPSDPGSSPDVAARSLGAAVVNANGGASGVVLSTDRDSFAENDMPVPIRVTATRDNDVGDLDVYLHLSGTAARGTDYTVSPSTLPALRIGSGTMAASTTLEFTGVPDAEVTGDKTITIAGTVGLGTVGDTDVTIKDSIAKPGGPAVTRTQFDEPAEPALDVNWTAPTAPGDAITGYRAQYRKQGDSGWTQYSGSLPASATKLTLSGLEPGGTYEVRVRALRGANTGPWSGTGSGTANRPPTRTLTGPTEGQRVDVPWNAQGDVRSIADYFADADGDGLTYVAGTELGGIISPTIEGDSLSDLRIRFLNPAQATITFGASDGFGGYLDDWLTIVPIARLDRSIPENSAAGSAVGEPITGTPFGQEEFSYALTGNAADVFDIDSSTGQIAVKEGAALDYETKSSYYGKVTWAVQGQTATARLTINVTDVGPAQIKKPALSRTAFSQPANPALDVSWGTPDVEGTTITGYEARYRKLGETDWTDYDSAISASATSLNLPDLEAGAIYEAQVRALTAIGESGPWSYAGSRRSNHPPQSTEPPNLGISYQPAWGGDDLVLSLSDKFADEDEDALTFAASTPHPGVFTVTTAGSDPVNLRVQVLNPATSTVTYSAFDGYGGKASFTIDVSGVSSLSRAVSENSGAGTAVGDPIAGTPYNQQALRYALSGDAAGAFVIDSATGQIRVKQGATIHYDTKSSYSGRVSWVVQGQEAYADLTIHVRPLAMVRSVGENYPAGISVGHPVTWAAGGGTQRHTLTGEASTSGAFVIDSATGQIRVGPNAGLDHETKSSYSGQVDFPLIDIHGALQAASLSSFPRQYARSYSSGLT